MYRLKTTSNLVYFPSKSLICQEVFRTCFWNNIFCYPNNVTSQYHYYFDGRSPVIVATVMYEPSYSRIQLRKFKINQTPHT